MQIRFAAAYDADSDVALLTKMVNTKFTVGCRDGTFDGILVAVAAPTAGPVVLAFRTGKSKVLDVALEDLITLTNY